ncbi:MAG: hypothetical protein ACOY0T_15525 [Myxococcota bacterium]
MIASVIERTNARHRDRFRICHFSVQSNHLHLIVEAADRDALLSGMRGLGVSLARQINRLLGRKAPFIADRWHGRALETPRAARNVLVYVFANFKKHDVPITASGPVIDLFSSAPYFRGFLELNGVAFIEKPGSRVPDWLVRLQCPVEPPRTWLLSRGWMRHGLISGHEAPRSPDRQCTR